MTDRPLIEVSFPAASSASVLGDRQNETAHQLLRQLYAIGQAAGNLGDLYDNRDRGHSQLRADRHPQLSRILYDTRFRDVGWDYGLAADLLFNAPVIGNSSTAIKNGRLSRSLPRMALTAPEGRGADLIFQNYITGQIHVYPEHRDHDPQKGDLFPANTPYYLISQGSSGSDKPFLEALAMILAAFHPDTKARLTETGLLAPTVQMIFRRSQNGVPTHEAYLSGAAHPTVFSKERINLLRMVSLANTLHPDDIPPLVRLRVVDEDRAREGIDYFGEGLSEHLFDTPAAIARVWRSTAYSRSMVVSADTTQDPNGRPLTFRWVLLRGDPSNTRITPLDPDGRSARITLNWQNARPVPGQPDVQSARIDIGVFANNGVHNSAPSFVSVFLPKHERRFYDAGPDGGMRISSVDYTNQSNIYMDPLIFPEIPWRDDYLYNGAGRFQGWRRHRGAIATMYDSSGNRV
ncbi:hypothetical protein, partial [Pseudohalocynthiibacter sp. F2068]|uniref:hypothetical protein n=1 Tax=Pseudohalocynthiibacter sp. F2068 TaxID=2926418 RepID=UPI001FF2D926